MKNYFVDTVHEGAFFTDLAVERRRADTEICGVEYKKTA